MLTPGRCLLLIACAGLSLGLPMSSQLLDRSQPWRPTQPTGSSGFVGSAVCSKCHASLVTAQRVTGTARALRTTENCQLLASHPSLTFRHGEYTYQIVRESGRSVYKVSYRDESITAPVSYCVGHGETAQTYLLQYKGSIYESRVSFYPALEMLDFTLGASRGEPESLEAALGQRLASEDARKCFSCHATNAVSETQELRLESLTAGVSCEACHGPGAEHVAAVQAGRDPKTGIFSTSTITGDELSQRFCGSCHRSFGEVMAMVDLGGAGNVRFQPYRLAKSSCYQGDPKNRRISCVACHNPHEGVVRESDFYDAKCKACHATGPNSPASAEKMCSTATKKCSSCHMPKIGLPEAHAQFTDHFIRVARPGSPYPK